MTVRSRRAPAHFLAALCLTATLAGVAADTIYTEPPLYHSRPHPDNRVLSDANALPDHCVGTDIHIVTNA